MGRNPRLLEGPATPRHGLARCRRLPLSGSPARHRDLAPPPPPKDTKPRWAGQGLTVNDLLELHEGPREADQGMKDDAGVPPPPGSIAQ